MYIRNKRGPKTEPCGTPEERCGRVALNDDLLVPVSQETTDPLHGQSSDAIVVGLGEQALVGDLVKGLTEVQGSDQCSVIQVFRLTWALVEVAY